MGAGPKSISFSEGFDFSGVFETLLATYLPRPAIEAAILQQISEGSRSIIVTGEPGSGKSALAASLIRSGGYLHHLLRRGQTEFALWRDPHGFYTSIGLQLKRRYGDKIFPEAVTIDVNAVVHDVSEGAEALGAEIQRLVPVPWHSATISVNLHSTRIRGKAVGARIQEVADDYRRIPLTAYRQMALIDPLQKLQSLQPDEHVVLWVDGLDEEFEAAGPDGLSGISESLPTEEELALIGNLTIVISSRPAAVLDRFFQAGASRIDLFEARFAEDNSALVAEYLERELGDEDIRKKIAENGKTPSGIAEMVAGSCDNNLLYLRQFFEAIRDGHLSALLDGGIPSGLDEIYARLLGRVARNAGSQYIADIYPVLSVLAVAERGLTGKELKTLSSVEGERVNAAVRRLRPFLDLSRGEMSANVYALYHKSLRDTLTRDTHSDEAWFVDSAVANGRVAQTYLRDGKVRWDALDDYGYEHLIGHLSRADADLRPLVLDVLNGDWARVKRRLFRSHLPFLREIETASSVTLRQSFPESIIGAARLALMSTVVIAAEGESPDDAMELMVRMGQIQRALDSVHPMLEVRKAVQRLTGIIGGLERLGPDGTSLRDRVLKQALERIRSKPDHGDLCLVLERVAAPVSRELLGHAVAVFNDAEAYWATPSALTELARLFAPLDSEQSHSMFLQGLDAINRFTSSNRSLELNRLFRYWLKADPERALDGLNSVQFTADEYTIRILIAATEAAERTGRDEWASALVSTLNDVKAGLVDPFERSQSLTAEAGFQRTRDAALADSVVELALSAAFEIGTPGDPKESLGNRKSQRTTALADIAAVDVNLKPARAEVTLRRAWESLEAHGAWNTDTTLTQLTDLQFAQNADLLEARIESINESELRAKVRIAAGLRMAATDREAAEAQLEQALIDAETPPASSEGHVYFALSLARAIDIADRQAADRMLKDSCVDAGSIAGWRTETLRLLLARQDPAVQEWLMETAAYWVEAVINVHYMFEFPNVARDLPPALLSKLDGLCTDLPPGVKLQALRIALGAALEPVDRNGRNRLNSALDEVRAATPETSWYPYVMLAFAAGQWWRVDTKLALDLWIEALMYLETTEAFANDSSRRFAQLEMMLSAFEAGAPEAALAAVLSVMPPAPEPGTISFRVPGPGVPAPTSAGMELRDYLAARGLGRAAVHSPRLLASIGSIQNPSIRSLAASGAAVGMGLSVDEKMQLCEVAQSAALAVSSHHLRMVLLADVAHAFYFAGIKKRGIETARAAVRDILDHGEAFGAIQRKPAYEYAFGRCMQLLARDPQAASLIWEGHRLGPAFHASMAHLTPALAVRGRETLAAFAAAESAGRLLLP